MGSIPMLLPKTSSTAPTGSTTTFPAATGFMPYKLNRRSTTPSSASASTFGTTETGQNLLKKLANAVKNLM